VEPPKTPQEGYHLTEDLALGAFDADHFISPEEQFRIAMARQ
jgi:hypothetical protein